MKRDDGRPERIMALLAVCLSLPSTAAAGVVVTSGDVPWITGLQTTIPDNDDYVGDFAASPNKFNLNSGAYRQNILALERIIPTAQSTGITEYALEVRIIIDVSDEFPPPTSLDSLFLLQLGFGTGQDFVRASEIVPDLRFDSPENVSPPVEDQFSSGETPILDFIEHEGDTLTYRGNTCDGDGCLSSSSRALRVPIDIPNLDAGLRDHYTADELALVSEQAVPFTIRMLSIPDPSRELMADIDGDGEVDTADVDLVVARIVDTAYAPSFDLTYDGDVNFWDLMLWLYQAAAHNGFGQSYLQGDANLDGQVNARDLNDLGFHWQQEVARWSAGDFNADGVVNRDDLNVLGSNWQESIRLAPAAVPEPTGLHAVIIGMLLGVVWGRRCVNRFVCR